MIGTVTTNTSGALLLSFTANATNALVNAAMQQIAYENTSKAPPASVQIDWTVNDGGDSVVVQGSPGALQVTGSTTINITPVNDMPTGAVTIDNTTPDEHDLLTSSNTLFDKDGLGTITYQWQRDVVNISGATGSTHTTIQADVGSILQVVANYTDAQGSQESVPCATAAAVLNVEDPAVISGIDSGIVTEDVSLTGSTIVMNGNLTFTDTDKTFGNLDIDTAGNWTYAADNNQIDIQKLDSGQVLTEAVTISPFDGTPHTLLIDIVGSEDAPVISGVAEGVITKDEAPTFSNSLAITDVDSADNSISFPDEDNTLGDNEFGHFTLNSGVWTYHCGPTNPVSEVPISITTVGLTNGGDVAQPFKT
jgi:VCBS repeat-containing protein